MTCLTRTLAGLVILATVAAGPTLAQYTPGRYVSPYARPAVSPYINLLRPGANPAVNYYGLVRPQMNMYNSLQNLQQQQASAAQSATQSEGPQEVYTGHHAQFMTQSRYFLNNSGNGGGGLGRGLSGRGGPASPAGSTGRPGLYGGASMGGVGAGYPAAALRR